jgi:hypothetical protein
MLVVVAVVALLLGAESTRRRWAYHRRQAAYHAAQQRQSERNARAIKAELIQIERLRRNLVGWRCGNEFRTEDAIRDLAAGEAKSAAYHARLKEEYLRRW